MPVSPQGLDPMTPNYPDACCRPFEGVLKSEPVKSNGLSELMRATSDSAGAVKNPTSGMTPPKESSPQVAKR